MQWSDALGKQHHHFSGEARIVSLVPSLTELLCDLGLAGCLVGRTGFCVHPRPLLKQIAKVGGTKGFSLDKVRALAPTHVIANIDENRCQEVEALRRFVPHLIVTHPLDPRDNPPLYRLLGGVFGRDAEAERLCLDFEREWAATAVWAPTLRRERVLYLIWREPWFSVARDTYISRMLAAAGWDTLPAVCSERYPVVDMPALAQEADLVLLPSEPYPFRERDRRQLAASLPRQPVLLVDGEMVSWYGSRAIAGLAYLRALRSALGNRC